jgi:alpha-L-rhamnosidase
MLKNLALMLPLLLLALPALASLRPMRLTCEYQPEGVDTPYPRLSWILEGEGRARRQTAYQILVATGDDLLAADHADLWDSGRVDSAQAQHIVYAGRPLTSGLRCAWKVRVWDESGQVSAFSPAAHWTMGLLDARDWHGRWIGRTTETAYQPAPYLRHTFALHGRVKRATAYVCGLGYYELHLNGHKVGDHVLDPGYTRYDRRALYVTYDVTHQLQTGENAVGILLGTGWQNVHTRAVWYFDKAPWRAAPKALLELRVEYEDGGAETIVTDGTWKTTAGPILYDSIYGGQTYDARKELAGWDAPGYDDSNWEPARVVEPPLGRLTSQPCPPIRVMAIIKPVSVAEPKPGVFLFDMGQNFAGWAELTVDGPAGAKVTMKYGERLHPDGTLDQSHLAQHLVKTDPPQRFQTDEYILKGAGRETWHAQFCYHGFQYVEVTGFPGRPTLESLRGLFIHSDVAPIGEFECSNPDLNRLWQHTRMSYLSNLESIPTDCPHREKNGWTGDAHLAAEFGLLHYDSAGVYAKWINDLGDEQRPTGELPGIVPSSGWGYEWGNGPAWDSAFLLIPWYCYIYDGDRRILETHYAGMKRYVDYLTTRAENGIVSIGLGDWVPYETETPVSVTSTAYYYRDARIVAETAALLGKTDDARRYAELAERIKQAFNRAFYHADSAAYANGSQTALSCALYQDLVAPENREAVLKSLVAAVERRGGHIDTGILGAKYILHALADNGRTDVAYAIANQKTAPGWLWWQEQGATTLWESWGGTDSRNHIMFGDISAWFVETLAGIRPDAPGFAQIRIQPHLVGDLTSARAQLQTVQGRIVSDWKLDGATGELTLHVEVPANTRATVYVPAADGAECLEGGMPAAQAEGVTAGERTSGYAVYAVGSGSYTFTSQHPR